MKIGIGIGIEKRGSRWASIMGSGYGDFATDTENWDFFGSNTIEQVTEGGETCLKITYVDNANGARIYLKSTFNLTKDLIVGKTYKVRVRMKVNMNAVQIRINGPDTTIASLGDTDFTWYSGTFVASHATLDDLRIRAMGEGQIAYIDKYYIYE